MNGTTEFWKPAERTARWLALGMAAVLVDGVLNGVSSWLSIRYWDQEAITPDAWIGIAAVIPQIVILAALLVLARDVGSRQLWKSSAGFFACTWLALAVAPATLDVLADEWIVAWNIVGAVLIAALLVFLFSKYPTFTTEGDGAVERAAESDDEDAGAGWLVHVITISVLIGLRFLIRGLRKWFPGIDIGADDVTLLELVVLLAVAMGLAIWFSRTTIRLRTVLGPVSAGVGLCVIASIVIHVALAAAGIVALVVAVANNPQFEGQDFERLFNVWGKRGTIATGICYGFWTLVMLSFFASVRRL